MKAHRRVHHSTLGSRVIIKKKSRAAAAAVAPAPALGCVVQAQPAPHSPAALLRDAVEREGKNFKRFKGFRTEKVAASVVARAAVPAVPAWRV